MHAREKTTSKQTEARARLEHMIFLLRLFGQEKASKLHHFHLQFVARVIYMYDGIDVIVIVIIAITLCLYIYIGLLLISAGSIFRIGVRVCSATDCMSLK